MTPDALFSAAADVLQTFFATLFGTECAYEEVDSENQQVPSDHRLGLGVSEDGTPLFEILVPAQVGAGIAGMEAGKLAAAYERAGGVYARVRFASSPAGDDLKAVADERVLRVETPYGPVDSVIRVAVGAAAPARSPASGGVQVAPAAFAQLGPEDLGGDGSDRPANFSLLREVELDITVELGRRSLSLAQVLRLAAGSVLELDRLVGEPLGIYANGHLIAEGEAVVLGEQLGVRVTRLVAGAAVNLHPA